MLYADLGYNVNPFHIAFPSGAQSTDLSYKNNFSPFLGLGLAYKKFHLRAGFPVVGNLRPLDKFGKSAQYNFSYDISYKRLWYDFEFKSTFGYALKQPNVVMPDAYSLNAMLNAWFFANPEFQMIGLLAKRAHYTNNILTWYLKGSVNFFGSENKTGALVPINLQNQELALTQLTGIKAFDIGASPGLAFVQRKKNWQFGGWAGVGPAIQFKGYATPSFSKVQIGVVQRIDLRILGGYSTDEKFFFLVTDFDNKSIGFGDFSYRQVYFALKFVAGYRFKEDRIK